MKRINKIVFLIIYIILNVNMSAQNNSDDVVFSRQISQHLITPVRLCIDTNDNLYTSDNKQQCVVIFDESGNFTETVVLDFVPLALAVNKNNELFISDKQTGNIYKRIENGDINLFYEGCSFPADMEFGTDDLLYIVDSHLHHVIAIDESGQLVKTIGEAYLIFPSTLAFDKKNQQILIGEHGGIEDTFIKGMLGPEAKVWIFDTEGNFINSFGDYGDQNGEFYRIQGITIGECNNIYVCDSYQGNISVFDEEGNFLTKFSEYGNQTGQLDVPLGIAYNSKQEILIGSLNKGTVDIFTVNQSLPTSKIFNSDAVLCPGETGDINLELKGTAPWTFKYTFNGIDTTEITTSESNYLLTASHSGIYEITQLTDATQTGTCFTGSAVINILDAMPASDMTAPAGYICEDQTGELQIDFSGNKPWTFTYTKDDINPKTLTTYENPFIFEVSEPGEYKITSLTDKYCIGSENTGVPVLNSIPNPTSIILENIQKICTGTSTDISIDLTGTPPWTFTYLTENENPTTIANIESSPYILNVSEENVYEITELSDAYCTITGSLGYSDVQIYQNPVSDFNYSINDYEISFSNLSQNANDFNWNFGDGNFSEEENPVHVYDNSGTFEVELIASNGICDDQTVTKSILIANSLIDNEPEKNFEIYPNPSGGIIYLDHFPTNSDLNINIYSITGEIVYSDNFKSVFSDTEINLSNLKSGIYFIHVTYSEGTIAQKLVINK